MCPCSVSVVTSVLAQLCKVEDDLLVVHVKRAGASSRASQANHPPSSCTIPVSEQPSTNDSSQQRQLCIVLRHLKWLHTARKHTDMQAPRHMLQPSHPLPHTLCNNPSSLIHHFTHRVGSSRGHANSRGCGGLSGRSSRGRGGCNAGLLSTKEPPGQVQHKLLHGQLGAGVVGV